MDERTRNAALEAALCVTAHTGCSAAEKVQDCAGQNDRDNQPHIAHQREDRKR